MRFPIGKETEVPTAAVKHVNRMRALSLLVVLLDVVVAVFCIMLVVSTLLDGRPFENTVEVFVTICGILFTLIAIFNIAWGVRTFISLPYRYAALGKLCDNARELAEWTANDPQFAQSDDDCVQQLRIRGMLETLDETIPFEDRIEQSFQLINMVGCLHDGAPLARIYFSCALTMIEKPRMWRAIDVAYREIMRQYTSGMDISGITVAVEIGKDRSVRLVPDYQEEKK